ncbi:MAG: pyrimidine 5'-nucleotidase [Neisseriaceae bacterium]
MDSLCWLFDLDNTLYQAGFGVFERINQAMTQYLMQHLGLSEYQASCLWERYWLDYGATLSGLIRHHPEIDVNDFLANTHSLEQLLPCIVVETGLHRGLSQLKGKLFVFSNAPHFYVQAVLKALHLESYFQGIYGCDDLSWYCKPNALAYKSLFGRIEMAGIFPNHCILIDDHRNNLKTAKKFGLRTVLLESETSSVVGTESFVDLVVPTVEALAEFQNYWLGRNVG